MIAREGRTRAGIAGLLLALVAALTIALPGQEARGADPVSGATLGTQAYDYGFPLLEFIRVRKEMSSVACPDDSGNSPINSFSHAAGFAGADDRTVVAPNTDTLYSIAHLDLRKGPVTLEYPKMGRRYFGFALLDPYTNVIAIPGKLESGPKAGKHAIRWRLGPRKNRIPKGAEKIGTKYRRVWVIGRTLAEGPKDQRRAQKLMSRYRLTLPNGKQRRFDPGCEPGETKSFPTPTTGEEFVARLNEELRRNAPPKRDRPLLKQLKPYGVGRGLDPADATADPASLAAFHNAIQIEAAALPTRVKATALIESRENDGWYLPQMNIGDYGTDYAFRALIASAGLGANTPAEAIYPTGVTDGDGVLYAGINDYRLTFEPGNEPPARFFWSLTMYDIDGYLVPNELERYSVGPSHPPLVRKPDGSIVVYLSQDEPDEADVNWLPAPSGQFRLNLRLYGPRKQALDGRWKPPGVERLTAGIG